MEWATKRKVFISSDPKINRVECRLRSDGVMFCVHNCKEDGRADGLWEENLKYETTIRAVGEDGFDAEFSAQMERFNGIEEEKDATV